MISVMKRKKPHANDQGMALVTALLILVALTLIGMTAMTNTTIDTMISGNGRRSQQKFYTTEGIAEVALAVLPDLISGTEPSVTALGISDVNSLLKFDGDGDNKPDGNITAVVNAYLNTPNFVSAYCQSTASNDPNTYSVWVLDDSEKKESPQNFFADSNNVVNLFAREGQTTDLVQYTIQRFLIKHDGAVNLIDRDSGVSITLKADAEADGGNTGKEGIVTTDMNAVISLDQTAKVSPNGVVQNFDPFVNPSIQDLHSVMSLLQSKFPLNGHGKNITIGTNTNGAVQITNLKSQIVTTINLQSNVIRVQGNVTLTSNLTNKVLVIEDFQPEVGSPTIGLTINKNVNFEGLILLLPLHDTGKAIKITLKDDAKINGAMIASSLYDPNNLQSSPGIDLLLKKDSIIKYDNSKIASTGYERQFAVLQKTYLSN